MVPTFRPDAALKVQHPDKVQAWARRLGDTAGIGADTFSGLLAAIEMRHVDFARAGCRATDHGIEFLPDVDATEAEARAIWERAITWRKRTGINGVRPPQPVLTGSIASRVDVFHPESTEACDGSAGRSTEVGGVAGAAAAV